MKDVVLVIRIGRTFPVSELTSGIISTVQFRRAGVSMLWPAHCVTLQVPSRELHFRAMSRTDRIARSAGEATCWHFSRYGKKDRLLIGQGLFLPATRHQH